MKCRCGALPVLGVTNPSLNPPTAVGSVLTSKALLSWGNLFLKLPKFVNVLEPLIVSEPVMTTDDPLTLIIPVDFFTTPELSITNISPVDTVGRWDAIKLLNEPVPLALIFPDDVISPL